MLFHYLMFGQNPSTINISVIGNPPLRKWRTWACSTTHLFNGTSYNDYQLQNVLIHYLMFDQKPTTRNISVIANLHLRKWRTWACSATYVDTFSIVPSVMTAKLKKTLMFGQNTSTINISIIGNPPLSM